MVKKHQLEKFTDVEECVDFLYDLLESNDVIDHERFAVLISLMMGREINEPEMVSAVDLFYNKFKDNQPIK